MPTDLADLIARRADAVRARIAAAATASGRDPDAVTLVAVTKTHPIETVEAALAAGLRDLGENRVQELAEKAGARPGARDGGVHRWHLIGALQRNKARDAARFADLVHGVDSGRLAAALGAKAAEAGRALPVLVQVNVSGEASKSGVDPDGAHDLMAEVAGVPGLRLAGVMGLAAPAGGPDDVERAVRPAFRRLRTLFDTYAGPGRAGLAVVSMGMSGDYGVAVEEGSTLVRVGTALFGGR
ncbi:MAG TPA: YggS family pyridoxal phosphate-dependent enzyme [Rubricoccaceae bacterium]